MPPHTQRYLATSWSHGRLKRVLDLRLASLASLSLTRVNRSLGVMSSHPSETLPSHSSPPSPTFIDLFAGCGGLSLGLVRSGWRCLFAVERERRAFETYKHNLVDGRYKAAFQWPDWLPKQPSTISALLVRHRGPLAALANSVDLVVGGPPCQGFSFAGTRRHDDPRNRLFRHYVKLIRLVTPKAVLVENVRGIAIGHGNSNGTRARKAYLKRLTEALTSAGYVVAEPELILASRYGVPQRRPRVFLVGVRKDIALAHRSSLGDTMERLRVDFLRAKGLPTERDVTVRDALGDLLRSSSRIAECKDPESPPGFSVGLRTEATTAYQRLMQEGSPDPAVNSHRFANHRPTTVERFRAVLAHCRRGVQLSRKERKPYAPSKKHVLVALDGDKLAHTITTLPDDLVHYRQPRILTVREMARLQSFPDWFEFCGKYTTGGPVRTRECPRYTQVGNAVAPLVAEIAGHALRELLALPSATPMLAATGSTVTQPTEQHDRARLTA